VSEMLEREIAALPAMNIAQLRVMWQQRLKEAPPSHVRKQLLVPILAYKLQEQAYGGLRPEIRRQLEKIAGRYRQDGKARVEPIREPKRIKPGTRLLRQWNGETHRVLVVEDGFEYEGQRYKSMSMIARKITGTRWSGPLFFGLKDRCP
jgi:hypothetical protein